ncbi:hypothetical protein FIBSPDRAFT_833303 [Athelia psychrophila]|uniref:Uncharacterized protein n=1 Tax=Athelia psychrophila TaxID=1759441 RepID=A0A166DW87_9AGAM|nr:hypothetical protein FIBSPDRAFT_833303 [Fibularhizoctonia sp. CBS 109695]
MAFLLLIPVIIEAVGEGAAIAATEAAVAAAASEAAAAAATAAATVAAETAATAAAATAAEAATAAATAAAAEATATAAATAAAEAATASEAAAAAATAAGEATATGEGLGSVIWKGAQAFAKWAAQEVVKGALFEAAIKGLKATIHAYQVSHPSDEAQQMTTLITNIAAAHQSLEKCRADWVSWMDSHYDSLSSYGSVTVAGATIQNFQILQQKVGDLTIFLHQKIGPLLVAANKAKKLPAIVALQDGMKEYAENVGAVSKVVDQMGAMVSAGLQNHSADVQDAKKSLA